MKNSDISFSGLGSVTKPFKTAGRRLVRYRALLFFIAIVFVYSFIVWRINAYSNIAPSESETTAKASSHPHIDAASAKRLESLQDNSVSVQSLFDQARDNPFQE